MGVVNTAPDVRMNATFAPFEAVPGRVGFASQSGGLGIALIAGQGEIGLGISTFVSMGNKADVAATTSSSTGRRTPTPTSILLYLESFGNPRKFAPDRAPRRAHEADRRGEERPHAGRRCADTARTPPRSRRPTSRSTRCSGRRASSAWTRSRAVRRRERRARTSRCPPGRRVGIVSNGGGPGILAADACAAAGLEVPELSAETQAAVAGDHVAGREGCATRWISSRRRRPTVYERGDSHRARSRGRSTR